jgi:hypothetical protein
MRSLTNEKDVAASRAATEGGAGYIKLDQKVNYVCIVSPDYADGFIHYLRKQDKGKERIKSIPCKAGLEGYGFAPDSCPLCKEALELYDRAKKETNKPVAKDLKDQGNDTRASYKMQLYAMKGDAIITKNKAGVKVTKGDFDDAKTVQVLSFTEHQKKLLLALISDPASGIKESSDIVGKILRIEREEDGQKKVKSITVEGELDLSEVDLTKLPPMDDAFNVPEDYEAAIEEFRNASDSETPATKQVEDDEPGDTYRVKKPGAGKPGTGKPGKK